MIKIEELIKRPIIRDDKSEEFLNKMNDDEIKQWEDEIEQKLLLEGVPQKFPEWNAAFMSKEIDMGILYNLLKKYE
jgi:hypothetical protein